MIEFDSFRLLIIVIATILSYLLASYRAKQNQKVLLLFCFVFLGLYSGVGGALKETNPDYIYYYVVYLLILAFTIRHSSFYIDYSKDSATLTKFVDRNANKFIITYFLLMIVTFFYPEVIIKNLVSPPPPMLSGFDFEEEGNNYGGGAISSLIYLLRNFIMPFFYIGLYKYRDKTLKVLAFLLLDLYLVYCKSGYVGRGTLLQTAIICFFVVYYKLGKQARKRLILYVGIASPIILYGFYRYSLVRMGTDVSDETISQAVGILFGQEIGYPTHFNYYIKLANHHIGDYITWFLLLPLPGFLKFGLGEYYLNREFSMEVLGLDVSDSSFFILLPGVVGESIYVFGPYLFWAHAIMLGIFVKFVIKTFTSNDTFTYFYYLCIVTFSFMLARAGTISIYPIMMKCFIILIIVLYFVKRSKKKRTKYMKKNPKYMTNNQTH